MSLFKTIGLFLCACALLASSAFAQTALTEEEEQELLVIETREHVLAGNFFALNQILTNVSNITTVARGFRFEPEEAALFTRVSPTNRAGDADVVSIRSFARALLSGEGDADTLALVYTAVLTIQGPEFAPDPATTHRNAFQSFTNVTAMQLILDADPAEQDEEDEEEESGERRRLLVAKGKPADTPLCNSCFEKSFCKKNAPWC